MEKFYSNKLQCQVQRVSKRKAESLFNNGKLIFLQSCNLRFDSVWQTPMAIDRLNRYNATFSQIVNEYKYYECDNVRGRYPHYFVMVEQL